MIPRNELNSESKINDKVVEIQLGRFKNLNVEKLGEHFPEHLKGNYNPEMELNPDFPNNVIRTICEGIKNDKYVVMALKGSNIDFLIEHNFDFAFVVPGESKVQELKEQYISRGNTEEYIERNMKNIQKLPNMINPYNKTIYQIEKGQFLSTLIDELSLGKTNLL